MKTRIATVALAIAAATVSISACSSDKPSAPSSSSAPSTSATPTAAKVATGLQKIADLAKEVATAAKTDPTAAKSKAEGIEGLWAPIEDVVKDNDSAAYLDFEDNFALLESGEPAKASTAATKVASAVTSYVAKYPA